MVPRAARRGPRAVSWETGQLAAPFPGLESSLLLHFGSWFQPGPAICGTDISLRSPECIYKSTDIRENCSRGALRRELGCQQTEDSSPIAGSPQVGRGSPASQSRQPRGPREDQLQGQPGFLLPRVDHKERDHREATDIAGTGTRVTQHIRMAGQFPQRPGFSQQ